MLVCGDMARRRLLVGHPTLNGIDYIEVITPDQRTLRVTFVNPLPAGAYGLPADPARIAVSGGVRIKGIKVQSVSLVAADPHSLDIRTDQAGDFSAYTLTIDSGSLDPAFARKEFSFKAGCPSDLDCKQDAPEETETYPEPVIDYMAKDYASFRQALLDLLATRLPDFTERSPADLAIAVAELFAYVGDHLSYYQDAVANEAFLETARQRESVRRHARLIDYTMHDGANARTFLHVAPKPGFSGIIPKGTPVVTRIELNLGLATAPPYGPVIDGSVAERALNAAATIFETAEIAAVDSALNQMAIHTWGSEDCTLPEGTTQLDLVGTLLLKAGDWLLLEEILGPESGNPADADPTHRQVVRLIQDGEPLTDPLILDGGGNPQPLTRVTWAKADALKFPLIVSALMEDGRVLEGISQARGNLILADHGRTLTEWHPGDPADPRVAGIDPDPPDRAYRFRLSEGPLTFAIPLPDDPLAPVADLEAGDLRTAVPQATCRVITPASAESTYGPVPHLLNSGPFDPSFVVETDNSGTGMLRFGDGEYGQAPVAGSHMAVTYRVGNGAAGNVGAGALVHLIAPDPIPPGWPEQIESVTNPLPAWGGTDPEDVKRVKRLAPRAFRAVQYRAVTEADYAAAAETHEEVSRAVATFRWTGSWYTAAITVDPVGRTDLTEDVKASLLAHVNRYELSGYDVEIHPPLYVPLEIDIQVCVKPGYFRADVKEALLEALAAHFHPDSFTFGQPVYLSALYAAVEAVEGVESATVTRFRRWGRADEGWLAAGVIDIGRTEVARLDNDPNFPEHGLLRLEMRGGR